MSQDVAPEAKAPVLQNPWLYVPLLYFMQAIPVTIVQEVAAIFYKDLGIANEPIIRWTSLISLPWSMQLLFGPLVDLNATKRRWILAGQFLIAIGLAATAFLLAVPNAFEITLVVLGATAVTSALCNIATDGFYILSTTKDQQAKFVGVQTTCYRLGRLFCAGLLVFLVGLLTKGGVSTTLAWTIILASAAGIYFLGHFVNRRTVPKPEADQPAVPEAPGENVKNIQRTLVLVGVGLSGYFFLNALVRLTLHGVWATIGKAAATTGTAPGSFDGWQLPEVGKVIGYDLGLGGVGTEIAQLVVCGTILAMSLGLAKKLIVKSSMGEALGSFIRQPGFPAILFFILFYRFGEAMVGKMSALFLKDSIDQGGLAIANDQLGLMNGVAGVIGIVLGGLLGGYTVSRIGLRRAFWPLAFAMHVPNLMYVWASSGVKVPIEAIYSILFVDQFGYGFGFAGYMVYLMWVAQRGNFKTSHYAIGTGMGALCIAIAGVVGAAIQANYGYNGFFIAVIFMSIPGLLSLLFIPLDESHKQIKVEVE